ncbi:hypothetical protein PAXRUDRAFT_15763 [Paxillus rubicundulus Ve08.2h10]|uniref:Unplaced genomic scaffold scaffold_1185, whole genome shotgun sequence n=1 Tax=Paxillus rubicundulus Ve08.2h10 TaxID=930991 RepID=A0A0D0CY39_9AGAM|nr:hypothetical protein PAXRUDRAFT_15763 [Paxillus rubicundulus Ve08.2h10]
MSTHVPLLFGKNGVRTSSLEECQKILDVFSVMAIPSWILHGCMPKELRKRFYPSSNLKMQPSTRSRTTHARPHRKGTMSDVLGFFRYLKREKARVLYVHAPDRSAPFENTACEINSLHKEGCRSRWNLQRNGYVLPKVYQAMYNAITREMEPELVPCCRKYDIRLVVYNPLAGGLFAGKTASAEGPAPEGGRYCF